MQEKTKEAKKNLLRKVNRINKKYKSLGVPERYFIDIEPIKKISNTKELHKAEKQVNKAQSDTPIKQNNNLWLRRSEIRYFYRQQALANKRLAQKEKEAKKARREAYERFGNPDYKPAVEEEKARYTKQPEKFKDYEQFVEYISRINITSRSKSGLYGDDLKNAILKALRGEVYQQANGYKFKGGSNNPLADFIDHELSGSEVNILFGGNLNFEFIYSPQQGIVKEFEIIAQFFEFPALKKLFIDKGYFEKYEDYMEKQYLEETYTIDELGNKKDRLSNRARETAEEIQKLWDGMSNE